MTLLDNKAYFWSKFDENENPIEPRECQVKFNPNDGGKLIFLEELNKQLEYETKKDEIIYKLYGQAVGGKAFTLYNIKFSQANIQMISNFEMTNIEYNVKYIFYGGWYDVEKKIDMFYVRYSYMELFFNQMEIKKPYNDDERTMAGIMIHKEFLGGSTADYDVIFNIENSFNQTSFNNRIVNYEARNSLLVLQQDKFNLDEMISMINVLKGFFEILTFYSKNKIFAEELYLMEERYLKNKITKVPERIDILFQQHLYQEENQMSHFDFLFQYNEIKDSFISIMNNWIKNHNKNKNEYQAFCNVISDKTSQFNIYSHYFQIVSALESYHRLKNKDREIDEENTHKEYLENLDNDIKSCLNSEKRKKLKYKLQYSYGINFRKRINELIEESKIKQIFTFEDKVHQNIIKFIKDTRNGIAHLKDEIVVDEKIKNSFEYLKLIALLIMTKDLSLNHTDIRNSVINMDLNHIEENLVELFQ